MLPDPTEHVAITVPDLDLPATPISVSNWLIPPGSELYIGDRVVELLAGEVTVDLPAPASGRLAEQLAYEDDVVEVGQTLGFIMPHSADADGEP